MITQSCQTKAVKLASKKIASLLQFHRVSPSLLVTRRNKMTDAMDIAGMRKAYKGEGDIFDVNQLVSKEPFANFEHWFKEACATPSIHEANAMSLATATKEGIPSVRIVLLKGFDKRGFMFYSNYTSRKAKEMEENPHVSLCFFWDSLNKVVRVEGKVERLGKDESTQYFQSRPKSSQIGACVSHQSSVIPNREVLDDRKKYLEEKFSDVNKLPKPDYWGGFLVRPQRVEFWQGQTNRIHDRISFRRTVEGDEVDPALSIQGEDGWIIERLAP